MIRNHDPSLPPLAQVTSALSSLAIARGDDKGRVQQEEEKQEQKEQEQQQQQEEEEGEGQFFFLYGRDMGLGGLLSEVARSHSSGIEQ